jgi:integrase/recombinase XerD
MELTITQKSLSIDAFSSWLEMRTFRGEKELSTNSKKGYLKDVQVFLSWLGDRPASAETILEYFEEMKGQKSGATLQRAKIAIKEFIKAQLGNNASLAELAGADAFFKKINPAKTSQQKLTDDMLTEKEIKKAISKTGPKTELIIRGLYQTASRVSELINIRLSDCQVMGGGVQIKVTCKTRKLRYVFMRLETFEGLKKAYQGKTYLLERKGAPLSRIGVYTLIKRAGAKIGRADIHPHTFRHSWATNKISDMGLAAVSEYLGHADKSTTAKYYLHDKPAMTDVLAGDI